jgi:hypothetical protein
MDTWTTLLLTISRLVASSAALLVAGIGFYAWRRRKEPAWLCLAIALAIPIFGEVLLAAHPLLHKEAYSLVGKDSHEVLERLVRTRAYVVIITTTAAGILFIVGGVSALRLLMKKSNYTEPTAGEVRETSSRLSG